MAAIGDYAPWACVQRLKLHRRRGAARLDASTASTQSVGCRAPSWAAATAPARDVGELIWEPANEFMSPIQAHEFCLYLG